MHFMNWIVFTKEREDKARWEEQRGVIVLLACISTVFIFHQSAFHGQQNQVKDKVFVQSTVEMFRVRTE